jgi:integron integrase
MTPSEAYQKTWHYVRMVRRYRKATADRYAAEARDFVRYCVEHRLSGTNEERVSAYLSQRAPSVSAKTQNAILCSLNHFFDGVVRRPLGDLGGWTYARIKPRDPVWMTQAEVARTLSLMTGTHQLMAKVSYGSGLRLMECVRLRVKDVDLEKCTLRIVGAKGDKDRTVPLAQACVAPLADHMQRVRALWEADQAQNCPPVALPDGLERKFPNAGREWSWYWVWPQGKLSLDKESGIVRRHHALEDIYTRALKRAARQAGVSKWIKSHTLRHSYATHYLEHGGDVVILQRLLGHKYLETTQVYVHCAPHIVTRARSPLDVLMGSNVVAFQPFPAAESIKHPVKAHA